jgi:hypothetical protein
MAMNDFMYGIAVCSSAGASLFFLKYWRETRDRLFLLFAAAFVALSVNWLLLVVALPAAEYRHLVYMWRLAAFALILVAIWDKNRDR